MDVLEPENFLYLQDRQIQLQDHFTINGRLGGLGSMPNSNSTHGADFYNKTFGPALWPPYNETIHTTFLQASQYLALHSS